jgi:hypothetical protein
MSFLSITFPFVVCVDKSAMTTTATQVVRASADEPGEQGESQDKKAARLVGPSAAGSTGKNGNLQHLHATDVTTSVRRRAMDVLLLVLVERAANEEVAIFIKAQFGAEKSEAKNRLARLAVKRREDAYYHISERLLLRRGVDIRLERVFVKDQPMRPCSTEQHN